MLQWLIDQVIAREARVAVYLAPTRALVSEIETSLKRLLGNTEEIEVSSLPLPDKYRAARAGGASDSRIHTGTVALSRQRPQ